ncbi:MAG TPA: anhydro-N-acetylmuramic acid kinase [Candidatus Acidoferrales bacterium]|jgi:anhydro-N-acetylmuramic acid kinase|nr:anhydro-N-acetylmuramic acid kinase [Candidatus Acidoferrales bacterium]
MSNAMRVLGMMSGTSADGIDVALVRISGAPPDISAEFEAHHHVPFRPFVRETILRLANGAPTTTAEISELDFILGEELARAALAASKKWGVPMREISLIGSHGQTIFHLGASARLQGKVRAPSTLQIGEINVIAERTGVTTVGDFRPADMAAGGQGAPLVPFVDYLLYRDPKQGRAALNIGGIANVTVIPGGAAPEDVFAFDTGPGNMVIDALVEQITRGRASYDRDARVALSGRTIPELLLRLMREPYLRKRPPKSAGREQFGQPYAQELLTWGHRHHAGPADIVRTATVFTALSIADAFRRLILPRTQVDELIVTGGGAKNPLIMAQLAAAVPGIEIIPPTRFGVPPEAKEAFAFAALAYETYHGRPSNVPSATGARHPVVLGKIVHAPQGAGGGAKNNKRPNNHGNGPQS